MKIVKDWHMTTRGSSPAPVNRLDVDHGVRDRRDRRVGGRVTITDLGEDRGAERFALEIIGTRDGFIHGSSGSSHFADLAAAKASAIERLERQGKGFRKTYGGRT